MVQNSSVKMVKLYCNCLNICINIKGKELKELKGESFLTNSSTDDFFKGSIYEIQLAVGGIRKEQEILMRERQIEDWTVFKCLGCNTEPFAFHSIKREDRVLVSHNIQNDERKSFAALAKSENMSPAFKIILQPVAEDEDSSANGFSSESMTVAELRVQERVKRFLKCEEDDMLERIRRYTEEQKRLFTTVQSRAHSDKRAVLSILRQAAENKVQESLSDAMTDLERESVVPDERPLHGTDFLDNASAMRLVQTPSTSTSWNSREKQSEIDNDHLDPLFHSTTEDFQPQPFVDSDEEESSDNSFNQTEMEYEKPSSKARFSSSVPVSVPLMNRTRVGFRERSVHDDDCEEMPSPDKIAESIQALARSMHDSRDIFGELPRPRKNTLPITFN